MKYRRHGFFTFPSLDFAVSYSPLPSSPFSNLDNLVIGEVGGEGEGKGKKPNQTIRLRESLVVLYNLLKTLCLLCFFRPQTIWCVSHPLSHSPSNYCILVLIIISVGWHDPHVQCVPYRLVRPHSLIWSLACHLPPHPPPPPPGMSHPTLPNQGISCLTMKICTLSIIFFIVKYTVNL